MVSASMSVSVGEPHPGGHLTISQLLYAAKAKLDGSTFDGRVTATMNQVEVDLLEQDALKVLGLVRSMKNNFVPINRIPGAVLSLIPNYWDRHHTTDTDADLITLTHVCRSWRKLFTSRPSLWTRLDFANVDKAQAYIERSRSSPLEVTIRKTKDDPYVDEALLLTIAHLDRTKSLTICGTLSPCQSHFGQLAIPAPFLKELIIDSTCDSTPALETTLRNRGHSSVHLLDLVRGDITSLPWSNLRNLTTFELRCAPGDRITVMRLLNFLENAPQLRDITLRNPIPAPPSTSPTRSVPLPHLKNLTIFENPGCGILLIHLFIPESASLVLNFHLSGDGFPLPDCIPKSAKNLKNLFRIITVNVCLDGSTKSVRLLGPSGGLYMFGHWDLGDETSLPHNLDCQILRSLDYFSLYMTQSLTITSYEDTKPTDTTESSPYCILLRTKDLHTLTLIRCHNLPFISALNPDFNSSKTTLCPNLEELVLYFETRDAFCLTQLMGMVKERASRGAKLRSVTVVGLGELLPGKEIFKLREHVTRVEYRVEENPPKWDSIP